MLGARQLPACSSGRHRVQCVRMQPSSSRGRRAIAPAAVAAAAATAPAPAAAPGCNPWLPPQHARRARRSSHTAAAAHAPPELGPGGAEQQPRAKLAVFVSGGGSNFKAIHAACMDGRIHADVVAHGLATLTYPVPKKGGFEGLTTEQLITQLAALGVEYVLLAGYLKLIPAELVRCYTRRMLNIHPGLLPSFGGKGYYGERVHRAVIASGARFSGPTVHFVDAEYDTGPILAQRVVPVLPTDTPQRLAARVLKEEHVVYPEAVSALVDGRITWREDGIPILWSAH